MPLRRGGSAVKKMYRGTTPVKRVYRGTTIVWEPTIYPVSGSWPWSTQSNSVYTTYSSHTIAETGTYTISLTVWSAGTVGATVRPRISGPWGDTTGSNASDFTTVTTSQTLTAGAVVTFQSLGALDVRGEWTITKTAPLY